MKDKFVIKTNLKKAIFLRWVTFISVLVYFYFTGNKASLLVIFMVLAFLVQYYLSKKLISIIFDDQIIHLEYLKVYKRKRSFHKADIYIEMRAEVHFRGGRNEIIDVFLKENNHKICEVTKRLFKSESDFNLFITLLNRDKLKLE